MSSPTKTDISDEITAKAVVDYIKARNVLFSLDEDSDSEEIVNACLGFIEAEMFLTRIGEYRKEVSIEFREGK